MRILIITGKQAYQKVKEVVKKYNYVDVHMANISIAAFLTPRMIIREIKSLEKKFNKPLSEIYDFVLVTGLISHDLKVVEEETGIGCYKSTREASDIPLLLDNLERIELSTREYADIQIMRYLREEAENLIREYEERPLSQGDIKIGSLKVGDSYPMRVLGEIVHVPWLKDKELERRVLYYVESGADMIDLGMVPNEDHSKDLERILKIVRDITDKPVSIDTMNTKELIQGIKLDVDMILSVDGGNLEEVLPYLKDGNTVPVVLPTNYKLNIVPRGAMERVEMLEENIGRLREEGIKVVGDPILEPINNNFLESVIAYKVFKERNRIPTFFGAGNVSELLDADSNGVNALLAAIGSEVGANILFTPEASPKCKFSIKELKVASKMMFLAKIRGSIPKDVGFHLINYKDKKFEEVTTYKNYQVPVINAEENPKVVLDRVSFKVELDREEKVIVVIAFDRRKNPICIVKGRRAKEIYDTLIRENLIGRIDHGAYIGRELQKAEIALRIGKRYVQDFELFYNEFWED